MSKLARASESNVIIRAAVTPAEYAAGKALIEEYAAELRVDLCFQNFSGELANLTTVYGLLQGCLLLVYSASELIGCVGVRALQNDQCEMKRLYVKPAHRGRDIGRRLAEASIHRARQMGYRSMSLDTLPSMTAARALYRSLGFKETEPYYRNPLDGVEYISLDLTAG